MTRENMKELWKHHPTIEYLEASSLGRLRMSKDHKQRKAGTIIKQCATPNRTKCYCHVTLDGKRYSVHRLVMEAWGVGNEHYGNVVHHIDNDGTNNCVDNLIWTTSSHNQLEAYRVGKKEPPCGQKSGRCTISDSRVRLIRHLHKWGGQTQRHIAKVFGISQPQVCRIVTHQQWAHLA